MKSILDLSPDQLRRAAQIKDQITSLEKQMQALLGQSAPASPSKPVVAGGMSKAARAKISAAMKARWAKRKAGSKTLPTNAAPAASAPRKRKPMSAAQRAQIAETLRARWAKIKAGKK